MTYDTSSTDIAVGHQMKAKQYFNREGLLLSNEYTKGPRNLLKPSSDLFYN